MKITMGKASKGCIAEESFTKEPTETECNKVDAFDPYTGSQKSLVSAGQKYFLFKNLASIHKLVG